MWRLVLGGDDSVISGSLLALRRRGAHGLVFLDAHTDFYPPEDSPTGEVSDSELYLAFGHGTDLIADLAGAKPLVVDRAAALIGHRDPDEQRDTGAALVVSLGEMRETGAEATARRALAQLDGAGVERFLLHIDADVLDDALMPAVDYRLPDGFSRRESSSAEPRPPSLARHRSSAGSEGAADDACSARRLSTGALHDGVEHIMGVIETLVPAGVARDEARLDLVGPRLVSLAAADESLRVGRVQPLHALTGLALQRPGLLRHGLELIGEGRVLLVAGSHLRGL